MSCWETEVKVKDGSLKMSVLGVCTGNLSLCHAYKVLRKYLLNQIQLPSLLCPSTELLLCSRLTIGFSNTLFWMTSCLSL